jgi:metallophosphoesterase superfamily enzyme
MKDEEHSMKPFIIIKGNHNGRTTYYDDKKEDKKMVKKAVKKDCMK